MSRIALLNVVVQHGGKQVVGRADGVEIAGEVQVDIFHRNYLCVSAACSAALNTKYRSQRWLAKGNHNFLA